MFWSYKHAFLILKKLFQTFSWKSNRMIYITETLRWHFLQNIWNIVSLWNKITLQYDKPNIWRIHFLETFIEYFIVVINFFFLKIHDWAFNTRLLNLKIATQSFFWAGIISNILKMYRAFQKHGFIMLFWVVLLESQLYWITMIFMLIFFWTFSF